MSSNLHRLRFMQKSEEKSQVADEKTVETLIRNDSMWIRDGCEEIHKFHDAKPEKKQKHLKIRYMSRKSYNGANPVIESYMVKFLRKENQK